MDSRTVRQRADDGIKIHICAQKSTMCVLKCGKDGNMHKNFNNCSFASVDNAERVSYNRIKYYDAMSAGYAQLYGGKNEGGNCLFHPNGGNLL